MLVPCLHKLGEQEFACQHHEDHSLGISLTVVQLISQHLPPISDAAQSQAVTRLWLLLFRVQGIPLLVEQAYWKLCP